LHRLHYAFSLIVLFVDGADCLLDLINLVMLCCAKIMDRMTSTIRPKARIEDTRKCVLCHVAGDAPTEGPGR